MDPTTRPADAVPHPDEPASAMDGRDALSSAVWELCEALRAGPVDWTNAQLHPFLEALWRVVDVIEDTYFADEKIPTDPWLLMADAIRAARYDD